MRASLIRMLAFATVLVFLPSTNVTAQSAAPSRIELIVNLGEMLSRAAEAIGKIGDSFAHITKLGVQGYDGVAARRAHNQLVDLRVNLLRLQAGSQRPTLETIEGYLAVARKGDGSLEPRWRSVVARMSNTAIEVEKVLKEVASVRSDFVASDAYAVITNALHGRAALLDKLAQLPAPSTQEELEALENAAKQYRLLLDQTERAGKELADYITKTK